jgi:hypothetical protein
LITYGIIHKRSKACSTPFFDSDVELFMRVYIGAFPVAPGRAVVGTL